MCFFSWITSNDKQDKYPAHAMFPSIGDIRAKYFHQGNVTEDTYPKLLAKLALADVRNPVGSLCS